MACSGLFKWRETKTHQIRYSRHGCSSISSSIAHNHNCRRPKSTVSSSFEMDLSEYARKLDLSETKQVVRKAAELRRVSDLQFDSSSAGIGEICKSIICLEIAANMMQVLFDRHTAIRLSGMSEKAYIRSFNVMQNGIGIKNKLDIRELAIQFGCVRLIPLVQKGLLLYKERFIASLPPSRRASADFTRPVFTATGFYLCAKKHKLKVDKNKLIELAGTSEDEFSSVSNSMKDLCHDVFGVSKEKKDPKSVKVNRDLLDALPEKRQAEDGGYSSDEGKDLSAYKKRKREENHQYEEWKSTVVESNKKSKDKVGVKKTKQAQLKFLKRVPGTEVGV